MSDNYTETVEVCVRASTHGFKLLQTQYTSECVKMLFVVVSLFCFLKYGSVVGSRVYTGC